MFKGDKKAKKQYRDTSGAGMLSNETMVSFQHAHLSVSLECDYFFFFYWPHFPLSMHAYMTFRFAMYIGCKTT
jgi:hypothetical protein